jgi:hypothetical protein
MRGPPNGNTTEWVKFLIQILLIPTLIWIGSIQLRVNTIEANRFTSGDAQQLYERIGAIEAIDAATGTDAGWLRTELLEIKAEVAALRRVVMQELGRPE